MSSILTYTVLCASLVGRRPILSRHPRQATGTPITRSPGAVRTSTACPCPCASPNLRRSFCTVTMSLSPSGGYAKSAQHNAPESNGSDLILLDAIDLNATTNFVVGVGRQPPLCLFHRGLHHAGMAESYPKNWNAEPLYRMVDFKLHTFR